MRGGGSRLPASASFVEAGRAWGAARRSGGAAGGVPVPGSSSPAATCRASSGRPERENRGEAGGRAGRRDPGRSRAGERDAATVPSAEQQQQQPLLSRADLSHPRRRTDRQTWRLLQNGALHTKAGGGGGGSQPCLGEAEKEQSEAPPPGLAELILHRILTLRAHAEWEAARMPFPAPGVMLRGMAGGWEKLQISFHRQPRNLAPGQELLYLALWGCCWLACLPASCEVRSPTDQRLPESP